MKKLMLLGGMISSSLLVVSCSSDKGIKKEMKSMDEVTSMSQESSKDSIDKTISDWPARPKLAAQEMMSKYGPPQEVSSERIVWNNQGPYKRIMVTRQEIPHDFPMPHMDFLEHTVHYSVPADKASELQKFDGSVSHFRTGGELSARCDLEGHNILTLNLARDIIEGRKTAQEARKNFGENVRLDIMGAKPAYVEALQFKPQPMEKAAFADTKVMPGSPNRATASTGKVKPDAEVLAFVMAVNMNEVLAAAQAQKKDLSEGVSDYARMLQKEHGKNSDQAMKLSQSSGVTPIDTMEVDKLKQEGAQKLADIIPLEGKTFETAFVNAMVEDHQKVLTMIDEDLMPKAEGESVKSHLKQTREHVAMHLTQARELQRNL